MLFRSVRACGRAGVSGLMPSDRRHPSWCDQQLAVQAVVADRDDVVVAPPGICHALPFWARRFDADARMSFGAVVPSQSTVAVSGFVVNLWSGCWPDSLTQTVSQWADSVRAAKAAPCTAEAVQVDGLRGWSSTADAARAASPSEEAARAAFLRETFGHISDSSMLLGQLGIEFPQICRILETAAATLASGSIVELAGRLAPKMPHRVAALASLQAGVAVGLTVANSGSGVPDMGFVNRRLRLSLAVPAAITDATLNAIASMSM